MSGNGDTRSVPRGHVFVVHGDLTQLACDEVIVPAGPGFEVSAHWRALVPARPEPGALDLVDQSGASPRWARLRTREGVWLLDTGSGVRRQASWYADGVRGVLRAIASHRERSAAGHGRARHLVALPLVGVGRGGADSRRGDVISAVLEVLDDHADDGHDVALVLRSARDHGAVQHMRRGRAHFDLSPDEVTSARDLAARARVNELALFLGAGVSMSAGLPSWWTLLDLLARRAGIPPEETAELRMLPAQDAATLIVRTLPEPLEHALGAVLSADKYGLSHALLAALPMWEAATTKYDDLFERAWMAIGRRPAVLPFEPAQADQLYLLKLHGDLTRRRNVVLTRDQYLRFEGASGALAGVVQGLLMTRHVLFAGFSLADENFLHLVDEVRRIREDERILGTALALIDEPMRQRMWEGELNYRAFAARPADPQRTDEVLAAAARRMEIFLDLVAHEATDDATFLLDRRYEYLLTTEERRLSQAVTELSRLALPDGAAGRRVDALLQQLGFGP